MAPIFPSIIFTFSFSFSEKLSRALSFHSPSLFSLSSPKSTKHSIPTPSPQKPLPLFFLFPHNSFPSFRKTEMLFPHQTPSNSIRRTIIRLNRRRLTRTHQTLIRNNYPLSRLNHLNP